MVTGRSMGRRTGGGMPGNEHVLLQQGISFSIPWPVPAKKDNSVG